MMPTSSRALNRRTSLRPGRTITGSLFHAHHGETRLYGGGAAEHKTETVKPYYYSVYLADHDVTTDITPTERAAWFRFTYPEADSAYVVLNALDEGSYVKILPGQRKFIGYSTKNSGGVPENFRNYFVVEFEAFHFSGTFQDSTFSASVVEAKAEHVGAVTGFKTAEGEVVNAKVERPPKLHTHNCLTKFPLPKV